MIEYTEIAMKDFVPVHAQADYDIMNYAPQGVGAHYLKTYHPKYLSRSGKGAVQ